MITYNPRKTNYLLKSKSHYDKKINEYYKNKLYFEQMENVKTQKIKAKIITLMYNI